MKAAARRWIYATWVAQAEAIGRVKRIRQPADWNEEMGAITDMAHQEIGAPALLFESIRA